MSYNEEELIRLLVESGLVILVKDDKYILNSNLKKFIKGADENKCKNYPKDFYGLSFPMVYKKVMDLCEIELKRKNSSGTYYFTRTMTKESVRILKTILDTPEIDFDRFISTTRECYASSIGVKGFANYLIENLWEEVYESGKESSDASKRGRKGVI